MSKVNQPINKQKKKNVTGAAHCDYCGSGHAFHSLFNVSHINRALATGHGSSKILELSVNSWFYVRNLDSLKCVPISWTYGFAMKKYSTRKDVKHS
jgi:ribosomal protein S14